MNEERRRERRSGVWGKTKVNKQIIEKGAPSPLWSNIPRRKNEISMNNELSFIMSLVILVAKESIYNLIGF